MRHFRRHADALAQRDGPADRGRHPLRPGGRRPGRRRLARRRDGAQAALALESWQLPELLGVAVTAGAVPDAPGDAGEAIDTIPIPVVPEVC